MSAKNTFFKNLKTYRAVLILACACPISKIFYGADPVGLPKKVLLRWAQYIWFGLFKMTKSKKFLLSVDEWFDFWQNGCFKRKIKIIQKISK